MERIQPWQLTYHRCMWKLGLVCRPYLAHTPHSTGSSDRPSEVKGEEPSPPGLADPRDAVAQESPDPGMDL
eukprot:2223349-Amphidinium_carterae.1